MLLSCDRDASLFTEQGRRQPLSASPLFVQIVRTNTSSHRCGPCRRRLRRGADWLGASQPVSLSIRRDSVNYWLVSTGRACDVRPGRLDALLRLPPGHTPHCHSLVAPESPEEAHWKLCDHAYAAVSYQVHPRIHMCRESSPCIHDESRSEPFAGCGGSFRNEQRPRHIQPVPWREHPPSLISNPPASCSGLDICPVSDVVRCLTPANFTSSRVHPKGKMSFHPPNTMITDPCSPVERHAHGTVLPCHVPE